MRRLMLLLQLALCGPMAQAQDSAKQLESLFEQEWDLTMRESPEHATWISYPGQNMRFSDYTPAALNAHYEHLKVYLRQLKAIDREALPPSTQISYDLAVRQTEEALEGQKFPAQYLVMNQLSGVHQDLAQLLAIQPAATVADYRDILARLKAVPQLIDQTIAVLNEGLRQGVTPPRITLRDVPAQIQAQLITDPLQSTMLQSFLHFPSTIPPAEQKALKDEAFALYRSGVLPAFTKLNQFFTTTYLPKTRTTISAADLPNGKEWYAYNARVNTTTTLSPEAIHAIGINEVARLRKEMEAVIKEVKFKGDFAAFGKYLRSDPKFYFAGKEQLLAAYRDIAKRIDPQLPRIFGKLPRLPYGVLPVPLNAEKSQPSGYYRSGSIAGGRAGNFFANTYDLKARPKWEMEALALHEAVPGHHLQIALAQEQEDLPQFRKHGGYNAFTEGWGLYAESLGHELGMYADPYSRYGQLTFETWRAVRLVVDTGMHALGWSRQQAIDYFRANTAKSDHDIVVEVDRYIVWPGQALSYKIGQLKIRELRTYAEDNLGQRFDERAFHDELLASGAVPLDLLEKRIKTWVAAQGQVQRGA